MVGLLARETHVCQPLGNVSDDHRHINPQSKWLGCQH